MAKSRKGKPPRPNVGKPMPVKPAPVKPEAISFFDNPYGRPNNGQRFLDAEAQRFAMAPKRQAGIAAAKRRRQELRPYGNNAQRFLDQENRRFALAPRRQAGIAAAKKERARLANLPKKPVPVGAGKAGGGATDDAVRMGKRLMGMAKKHPILAGAGVIGMGAFLGNRQKRGTSSGARGAYR